MTISLLARVYPRLEELTVSSLLSYTLRQISRVTRVTGRTANAVPCVVCDGALFLMPFALGRRDAERCQLGGCVGRDRVFAMNMPYTGDEQVNDRRHGDQITDTKAQTMLFATRRSW
jgi:hypothetical protein